MASPQCRNIYTNNIDYEQASRFSGPRDTCHPQDGYCYFNFTGFWVSPLKDEDPDFVDYAIQGINGLRGPDYHGHNQGRLLKYHFEGQAAG